MKSVLSPKREQELLDRLVELAEMRRAQEATCDADYQAAVEACKRERDQVWEALDAQFRFELAEAEAAYSQELDQIQAQFQEQHARLSLDLLIAQETISGRYSETLAAAAKHRDQKRAQANNAHSQAISAAETQWQKGQRFHDGILADLDKVRGDAVNWLGLCRLSKLAEELDGEAEVQETPVATEVKLQAAELRKILDAAREDLQTLVSLRLPRMFQGHRFLTAVASIWLTSIFPLVLLLVGLGVPPMTAILSAVTALTVICGGVGVYLAISLFTKAREQARRVVEQMRQHLAQGRLLAQRFLQEKEQQLKHRKKLAERTLQEQLEAIAHQYSQSQKQAIAERDQQQGIADQRFPRRQAALCHQRQIRLRQAVARHQPHLQKLRREFDRQADELRRQYADRLSKLKQQYEQEKHQRDRLWDEGLEDARAELRQLSRLSETWFPQWQSKAWQQWAGSEEVPPAIRFGSLHVDAIELLRGFRVERPWEDNGTETIRMPALLAFPEVGSLLIKAAGQGKTLANGLLCTVMFRLLTCIPPGKVRFIIFDPVGLGKDFAPFMHLADYNDQLVTTRIWTEAQQIGHRLTDLTEHMENVLQKYLRSEFATIEEYNASAGEVAEPYRILVVANFPANFNEATAERLLSVITSGPRCGVYTLLSLDQDRQMPRGFPLDDLTLHCQVLEWHAGAFRLDGPFAKHRLILDPPPPPEFVGRVVHVVGQRAKEVSKVEVPFSLVAPEPQQWWTGSTAEGISVPIGPAGARKLQMLELGQGTSQHVLMAGKTGSGKSTLLHVLITNLALRFDPDQVELYLIDFKKGVEFKRYASHRLPHARVVAIESEREFGLSVMQRLDEEMHRRGDIFRELGVQDLKGYRRRQPGVPLPRILLLVDEFQELFVEEDRLAQDCALLLDRLVRQGRAFGIHVLLGSQTLAGEYTLPRSTIGQMAIRIALQCSEADAHLILSDDNMAARLLSRPGEAIYNDANGLVDGNHPFQVAWLSDEQSDQYLQQVSGLAKERVRRPLPLIVFEGNRPANPAENLPMGELLTAPDWPHACRVFSVWLGDPVAIREPCRVEFRREGGKNLLFIGQNPDAGLASLATAVISLALQHPPDPIRNGTAGAAFFLFDGSATDEQHHGYFERLAEYLPHQLVTGGFRDVAQHLETIASELDRRLEQNDLGAPSIYLVLYDLQRFRDLRRSEDEFGFTSSYDTTEEGPQPAKLIPKILRDGPAFGIHTLVWCDNWNNLNRTFDRASMNEFELRVLFQMSTNDSSLLMDSPVAAKLGPHRGLIFSQAQDNLEKFRPYQLPNENWLMHIGERMAARMHL